METKQEHKCKESEDKIPFIRVLDDFTYECEFCGQKIKFEEVIS